MKTINNLSKQIALNEAEWDEQFFSIKNDPTHELKMSVSSSKNYSEMCFTTREAMYGFAKSLLFEALYGTSGSIEFLPQCYDGSTQECINGVRMTADSARLFVIYLNAHEPHIVS